MTTDAILFMIFVFAVCLGGFLGSLYLSTKEK
jgi:hypothetical protein